MKKIATLAATVAAALGTTDADATCKTNHCKARVIAPYKPKLHAIAMCESSLGSAHPHWHINSGNGFFGGFQFTLSTWRGVGGIGYPHWATKLEQRYRALRLARRLHFNWSSTEGWPICGAR
jgi:hypothetical protein